MRRRAPGGHVLLRAKITRPNPGPGVLKRPRLLQALADHAHLPLTLVVADAGYGKTTLLSSFSRTLGRPVVWYSLMPSDADLHVFARYLLEGFRREAPRFGRNFHRALEDLRPGGRVGEILGGTFVNELAALRGPTHLLVLDDFQEVMGDGQVMQFMETLLRVLPDKLRLLVASRSVPTFGIERIRARAQAFELNSSHLRFTRAELGTLFSEVYKRPLTDGELALLEETTLGWPTAVHLAHESLQRSADTRLEDVLSSFRASHLELHDYLSTEVYARLDASARRLLEATAALTRFGADLASTLTGERQPERALEVLARRGLLRSFGTGAHVTYECHELVRRFVHQEVENRDGAQAWRDLEFRTAAALEARGEPERALRHFMQAQRHAEAARLLRLLAPQLLRQGRAVALRQYLTDLPSEVLRADPMLALALADSQQTLGAWDEAERLYVGALEMVRSGTSCSGDGPPWSPRECECLALLGLGKVLNLRGQHEQVLGMAERGLASSHELPLRLRARLLEMKAGAHFYLGQYRAAVRVLNDVRALLSDSNEPELLIPTIHNLAIAHAQQGRLREASQEFRQALGHVRGTSSPRAPTYLSNLAFLLADLGELAEAKRAAEEGLTAARQFSNRAQECVCQQALAQILAQGGDLEGALASLHRADALNAELRMGVISADLLMLRGRIFCARGEYRRAVEFLNHAIQDLSARPDDPRLIECRALLAWCELRAGRLRVARDLLTSLLAPAEKSENDFLRVRVRYWLAEVQLVLGEAHEVDAHLRQALKLARERGYSYFLEVQTREEAAPALHALRRGIEPDLVSAALARAGPSVEAPLIELLARAPVRVAEAALAVLGEVGGRASQEGLKPVAKARRALGPAIRAALRHIDHRLGRGAEVDSTEKAPRMRLVLFGPPRLEIAGQPVPSSAWRAQRAFQMLIFLALHPRGASRDQLLETFWPGRQIADGRRNFHPTLSYIRKVLGDGDAHPILREGDFYRLNPEFPIGCDAWDLERAIEESRAARTPEARRAALSRAASTATGPFLEGLYGNWADALQVQYRGRIEKLEIELGEACAQAGDLSAALETFRRAVELDEYREETRLAVIECLVRLGNRRAALVEYEKLKSLLRTEMGVDPLPETEEAMQRLLSGQPVRDWPNPPRGLGLEAARGAEPVARKDDAPVSQAGLKGGKRGWS